MRKRITMSILLAALSMTVLSGCGGRDVSKTAEPQEAAKTFAEASQEDPEETARQYAKTETDSCVESGALKTAIPTGFEKCPVRVWNETVYHSQSYSEKGFDAFDEFSGEVAGSYNEEGNEYILDTTGTLYYVDVQSAGLLLYPKAKETGLKDLSYVTWTGADYGIGKILATDSQKNYIITDSGDSTESLLNIKQQGSFHQNVKILNSSLHEDHFVAKAFDIDTGKGEELKFLDDGIYTEPSRSSYPYINSIKDAAEGWYLTKDGVLYGEQRQDPFEETKDIRFKHLVRFSSGNYEDPFWGVGAVSEDNKLYLLLQYDDSREDNLLLATVSGFEGDVERIDRGADLVIKTSAGYYTGPEKLNNVLGSTHITETVSINDTYQSADIRQPVFESVFLRNDGTFIIKE